MAIFKTICLLVLLMASASLWSDNASLPDRKGPRPVTTKGVPHIQLGVKPVPELTIRLLQRVAALPDLEIRGTVISLPGTKGFWLNDDLPLVHPEIIIGGREFAHMHPDGSLHAALPVPLALEAVESGWAIHHPWAKQRPGWDGFVMLYTPQSMDELDVVFELILRSYNYITGRQVVVEGQ